MQQNELQTRKTTANMYVHVNTCTVDLYKMNLTLPLTDQQQLIELHQWTSGVAFQWERAMDLAEALPVNQ